MTRQSFIIGLLFLMIESSTFGQTSNLYDKHIREAEQHSQSKEYTKAARAYSQAFASNNNLGRIDHRYEAARCWTLAGESDSAFYNLERIAKSGYYTKYYTISRDSSLKALHDDKRWEHILALIKSNKEKSEPNLDELLAAQLDTIYYDDQTYRKQNDWTTVAQKDSINVRKVKAILDKYGWLGKDVVGLQGNATLFLVVQHADQATQERYLPMMREAVKNGKAQASSLALLEDRVALKQGKKQIYGSQIGQNPKTRMYYVFPLEDPENVDKRRAEVQLPPLSEYVKDWGIHWSVEQYKRDLLENVR